MKNSNALNLFIIILVLFSKQIGVALISPALPQMSADLSVSMYGIISSYFIGTAIGQILWGTLSDKFGRKMLMATGLLIYAFTSICVTFATTASFVEILRFIQGVSTGSMLGITLDVFGLNVTAQINLFKRLSFINLKLIDNAFKKEFC